MARRTSKSSIPKVKFASAVLKGRGGMRAVPRVFKKPKERLHDRRGRPSAHMTIIKQEAQRRVSAGELPRLPQLSAFVRALCTWFERNYPNLPQPKPRSVENVVRPIWQQRCI
jgi:hypothetical protein